MISMQEALDIANKKLKDSYYNSQLKHGWEYGLLSFELSYNECIYNGREAYHICVIGGIYAAKRLPNYKVEGNGLLDRLKNIDGTFDKDSNIECIIYKDNGEYQYLGE